MDINIYPIRYSVLFDHLHSHILDILYKIFLSKIRNLRKMYLLQILSFLFLAVSVIADFDTFQDVYSSITDSLLEFDRAISSINPDLESVNPVTPAATAVVNTIHAGEKTISAVPALTVEDMR